MDRNFKFPVTTIGRRPPPCRSEDRRNFIPTAFFPLSPVATKMREGGERARERKKEENEMHFAIGLTHSVLITEGGTVSYLATVAFLPSRLSYLLDGGARAASVGYLVGWLVGPYYLPTTKYERQRTNEGGCWKNVGSENSASSRDQPMEGELGGDDATTEALS